MSDDKDTRLLRAFLEGKRAERESISQWLRAKAYLTLSDLVKAGAHVLDPEIKTIRAFDHAERFAAIEREQKNRKE